AEHRWLLADLTQPSLPRLVLQSGLCLACYDLYMYAVHRLLHLGALYTYVHSVHHRSTAPSPATAFAIHPFEAILNLAFIPVAMMVTRVNFYAVMTAGLYLQVDAIVLHSGHEIFPVWWQGSSWSRWYPTVLFHDLHHSTKGA